MNGRPTFTQLLDHAEGRLTADQSRWIEDKLAVDVDAVQTLAWIEDFLQGSRSMPLTQPPPELSARLRAMFSDQGQPGLGEDWTTAHLLHDARSGVAGVRSTATDSHHLAFDSAAGRFIIEVRPAGADSVDLTGLVLLDRVGEESVSLTFLAAGDVRAVARCRRDGQFEARGIPRAVDELHLLAGDVRIRTELDLRED